MSSEPGQEPALGGALAGTPAGHVPEDVYGSWSPAPAPDGQRVAFVSDRSGEPRVWISGPAASSWTPLATTLSRVVSVSWSPDGRWLACLTATRGASRHEVWVVRPTGADLHLAGGAGAATAVIGTGQRHGWAADGRLMLTETDAAGTTAFLVHPESGVRTPVASGPLTLLLDASTDGSRLLVRRGPRTQRRLVVETSDRDGFSEVAVVTGAGDGSVESGALSPDGSLVYARSDVGRELAALVAVPVDGSAPARALAARTDAEVHDVVLAPDGRSVALVWNLHGGHSGLSLLDLVTGEERDLPLPRDVIDEVRFSADATALYLTAECWSDPRGVWRIEVDGTAVSPVSSRGDGTLISSRGASSPTLDATDVTSPTLVHLRSGDGTPLTGWLYRPDGAGPWPTVIHLHGGPEAQERPVYNSLFQTLVAAGIAVFAPNVRGSSGFGRSFVTADDGAGRYGAIADVAACAGHLMESGVAAPGRLGCMGRSYGGYLTLAALVWHPELFVVGVDVCGVANFATFYRDTEPWIGAAAVSKYGHPQHDAALLRDLSPISRIDRLRAPLLLVHGSDDTNVPVGEAEQVVAALAERGVEHEFLLFPGEGHELLDTANRVTYVRTTLAWLSRHLSPADPP